MKTSMILTSLIVLTAVGAVWADYDVTYTVELKNDGACVKFEDAVFFDEELDEYVDACLGEDGVVETDTFVVTLDAVVTEVEVTLKAGRGTASGTVTLGGGAVQIGTFLVEWTGDGISVTSDDLNRTPALSYIMFCFEGATVTAPEEGPYLVSRTSPYDEPTEVEEEEVDVD